MITNNNLWAMSTKFVITKLLKSIYSYWSHSVSNIKLFVAVCIICSCICHLHFMLWKRRSDYSCFSDKDISVVSGTAVRGQEIELLESAPDYPPPDPPSKIPYATPPIGEDEEMSNTGTSCRLLSANITIST